METGPPFYVVIRATRSGLAACSAKEVPSFLSHFKTLSQESNRRPSALQSNALPTELILPRYECKKYLYNITVFSYLGSDKHHFSVSDVQDLFNKKYSKYFDNAFH